jgi:folate-binding protein YgfZ
VGQAVWEALRIEAGLPAHGREVTQESNPWELGLEAAVAPDKGCYTGQESLNRLRTYGGVRRRLVVLELQGEEAPEGGSALHDASEEVGRITSAAPAPGEGRSFALGLVEGERTGPGYALKCGDRQAVVRAPASG